MEFRALISILLILAMLPLGAFAEMVPCSGRFAGISVERLVSDRQFGQYSLKELFGPGSHAAVGVSDGHAYLLVDELRFEGNGLAFIPPYVKSHYKGYMNHSQPGDILFKLDGLPAETIAKLKKTINEMKPFRSLHCYRTICTTLKKGAGISVDGMNILPSEFLQTFARGGFYSADGKPVPVKIYTIGKKSDLGETMKFLKSRERIMIYVAGGVVALTAVGGVVYATVRWFRSGESPVENKKTGAGP